MIARRVGIAMGLLCVLAVGAASRPHPSGSAVSCQAATVHLRPHPGVAGSLRSLPWVGAAPSAEQLVGLLWYWPAAWRAQMVSRATIYTGGHAPGGAPNMKVLWVFLAPDAKSVADAGKLVLKGHR